MRAWVGPELEGFNKGVFTLFVEGIEVDADKVINIIKLSKEKTNHDIKRLYLGAGGKGISKLTKYNNLLSFAKSNQIDIVAELYNHQLNELNIDVLSQIQVIYTILSPKDGIINYIKTDDHSIVRVYSSKDSITTNLDTLNNGLFEEDVLIYEEK